MNTSEKIEELKDFIKNRGVGQHEIAAALGTSQPTVSALINGKKPFGKKAATTWEKEFGINAAWLLTGEGNMIRDNVMQRVGDVHGGIGAIGRVGGNASIGVPDAEAIIAENALLREQNKKLLDQVVKLTERVGILTDRLIEK